MSKLIRITDDTLIRPDEVVAAQIVHGPFDEYGGLDEDGEGEWENFQNGNGNMYIRGLDEPTPTTITVSDKQPGGVGVIIFLMGYAEPLFVEAETDREAAAILETIEEACQ